MKVSAYLNEMRVAFARLEKNKPVTIYFTPNGKSL